MLEPVLSPQALDRLLDEIEADALEDTGGRRSDEPSALPMSAATAVADHPAQ